MVIAPETELYLLKCPLAVDEAHQIDFANATAQHNYFASLPQIAVLNLTYQRDNDVIFFEKNIEEIRSYNYVMYKNKQYGNKWFYAFITKMEYENNLTTRIYTKLDVFQTYMFDYSFLKSFVERETVDDDTFGKHLYPERIEFGDYILDSTSSFIEKLIANRSSLHTKTPYIVVQTSEQVGKLVDYNDGTTPVDDPVIVGGLPQGCWYYMFNNDDNELINFKALKNYLDSIGKGNAIINVFIVPNQVVTTKLCNLIMYKEDGLLSTTLIPVRVASSNTYSAKYVFTNKEVSIPSTFGTYTPKNNKTKCFPYQYFLVSNNTGGVCEYHYEDFNNTPKFSCIGTLSVNNSFGLVPQNSKKSKIAIEEIGYSEYLQGSSIPSVSWDSDYYLNWVAMNGKQIKTNLENMNDKYLAQTVSNGVEDFMELGTAGMVGGVVASAGKWFIDVQDAIAQAQIQVTNAKTIPNSSQGNLNGGDITFSLEMVGYSFLKFQIREDNAKRIDEYFSIYGYCVNEFKIPNTKSRTYWNYLKTNNANLNSNNLPQEACEELKSIYNTGITIWHNPNNFLNYNLNNTIVS